MFLKPENFVSIFIPKWKEDNTVAFILLPIFLFVAIVATCFFLGYPNNGEAVFILSLSLLLNLCVFYKDEKYILKSFYSVCAITIGTSVSYLGVLLLALLDIINAKSLPYICIFILSSIFTVVITYIVFSLSWILINDYPMYIENGGNDGDNTNSNSEVNEEGKEVKGFIDLKKSMSRKPAVGLSLFMSLFLSLMVFLSITFSSYDSFYSKENGIPAISMSVYDSKKVSGEFINISRFLFRENSSKMILPKSNYDDSSLGGIISRFNSSNKKNVCSFLTNMRYKDKNVQVDIIGHTNKLPYKLDSRNYTSNVQLAQARSRETLNLLLKCTDEFVVEGQNSSSNKNPGTNSFEWHTVAVPESGFFNKSIDEYSAYNQIRRELNVDESLVTDRSVEVVAKALPHPNSVSANSSSILDDKDLLDYIYFTAYTITTTGYGDIRPTAPMTKTLATMTNLLEILFIGIFFNLFMAFARSVGSNKDETDEVDDETDEVDGDNGEGDPGEGE